MCKICYAENRDEIELAWQARENKRKICKNFRVSMPSLYRHCLYHVGKRPQLKPVADIPSRANRSGKLAPHENNVPTPPSTPNETGSYPCPPWQILNQPRVITDSQIVVVAGRDQCGNPVIREQIKRPDGSLEVVAEKPATKEHSSWLAGWARRR